MTIVELMVPYDQQSDEELVSHFHLLDKRMREIQSQLQPIQIELEKRLNSNRELLRHFPKNAVVEQ